jgi:hypothetical protein
LKLFMDAFWGSFSSVTPEGSRLGHFGNGREELTRILINSRDVIRFKPFSKHVKGKKLDHVRERDDALFSSRVEPGPSPDVLFRPEEVHGASGIGKPLHPL